MCEPSNNGQMESSGGAQKTILLFTEIGSGDHGPREFCADMTAGELVTTVLGTEWEQVLVRVNQEVWESDKQNTVVPDRARVSVVHRNIKGALLSMVYDWLFRA